MKCTIVQADAILATDAAVDRGVRASAAMRKNYEAATSSQDAAGSHSTKPEGDCPICFEDFSASDEATEECATCKKHIHTECMATWIQQRRQVADEAQCVLCRSPWVDSKGVQLLTAVLMCHRFACQLALC
jgi:hypothetical protein